ncbi:YHS domain-containing protein [Siphonobacter aquaeclarae]|uniref:YHS domain-containing protein n=2 Tax=Siphonobacter aquaeclarae TaxID=563176 RepID=A0A1G9KBS8_9BACT|nr:YHS domain-containing protein [Siphonobacter aquaeclarae]
MGKYFPILILLLGCTGTALAQTAETRMKQYNLERSGLALQGYDPVSYFTEKRAVKGRKEYSFLHKGVTYLFSSSRNLDTFRQDPSRYEPQYGGWCAYAMGKNGEKVEVDPETFKIADGRLYLFYNRFFNNTLNSWNKDEAGLKTRADLNWRKFVP